MIVSMTGYGKGSHIDNGYEIEVEAKSVNHRFLDLFLKLPRSVENREHKVREILKKHIDRGRVSLSVSLRQMDVEAVKMQLNTAMITSYTELLGELASKLGGNEKPNLTHFLSLPDIFIEHDDDEFQSEIWQVIEIAVDNALVELNKMRQREGVEIEKDLRKRVGLITDLVQQIEDKTRGRSKTEFNRLYDRLRTMLNSAELDATRLELEVALLADRVDVTEECTRLKSHQLVFKESLTSPESAGRKLNFLLQEMNREANTIGAKCNDAEISHLVVQIKEEIEKLREQVQNVE